MKLIEEHFSFPKKVNKNIHHNYHEMQGTPNWLLDLVNYRISSYSFCGNYSFLNLTWCTVTFAHSTYRCGNCSREETIQGRKLFTEIRYMRKYGMLILMQKSSWNTKKCHWFLYQNTVFPRIVSPLNNFLPWIVSAPVCTVSKGHST